MSLLAQITVLATGLAISLLYLSTPDDAGSLTDAAGNILYSDPTSPQIFTIVSSNGQYSGIITYPSRKTKFSLIVDLHGLASTSCLPLSTAHHSLVMTGLQAVVGDSPGARGLGCVIPSANEQPIDGSERGLRCMQRHRLPAQCPPWPQQRPGCSAREPLLAL